MRALQMFFHILQRKGFSNADAYTVARFAIVNRCTLYIALYATGRNPDVLGMRTPAGRA